MRSGLVALLSGESTISALVGTRVYVSKAPQNATLPNIIITQMGSNECVALDGTGPLRLVTFDIDCRAASTLAASNLGRIVRRFIDDYTGTAGSQTIRAVIVNGETDVWEGPVDGSDAGIHAVTISAQVQYSEV